MPVLRATAGKNVGEVFELAPTTLIGRHESCQIRLLNRAVSRRHALIQEKSGEYWIEDLQSRNKTRVNDVVIDTPTRLTSGDVITVCDFDLEFGPLEDSTDTHRPVDEGDSRMSGVPIQFRDKAALGQSSILSHVDMSQGYKGQNPVASSGKLLKFLLNSSQQISRTSNVNDNLSALLDGLMQMFPNAQRGAILQQVEDGSINAVCLRSRDEKRQPSLQFSRQVIKLVMETKQAVLSSDIAEDGRFNPDSSLDKMQIQSLICAPQIGADGRVVGAIELDATDKRHAFTEDDLRVLAVIAMHVGLAIDNHRLRDTSLSVTHLRKDLEVARRVQVKFLPLYPPAIPTLNFFDFYQPAIAVGGDIYDYVQLPGNRIAVVVADVVGHGVAAALLMAKLSAEIRFSLGLEPSLHDAVARMNRAMCEMATDKFATMTICMIDTNNMSLQIANAGHQPPLLRRFDGKVEELGQDIGGLPLGIVEDETYEVFETQLKPGELLVLMTDGVWECYGTNEAAYGMQRFTKTLRKCHGNADQTGDQLIASVQKYIGSCVPEDDMCLVCVQANPLPTSRR